MFLIFFFKVKELKIVNLCQGPMQMRIPDCKIYVLPTKATFAIISTIYTETV